MVPVVSVLQLLPDRDAGLQKQFGFDNPAVAQAVHSGADLGAAIDGVMGYSAVSMKGKTVTVEPVPSVATPELGALLEAAQKARDRRVREKHPAMVLSVDWGDNGLMVTVTTLCVLWLSRGGALLEAVCPRHVAHMLQAQFQAAAVVDGTSI